MTLFGFLLVYNQPHQDVERLRQELDRYRQEQEQLRQTKARVLVMEERLRDLHWEDEVRQSSVKHVVKLSTFFARRSGLHDRFDTAPLWCALV